ncbi:MAG TPA: HK97 gp10 family phage protein [Rhizomicrobium sp.]
MLTVTVDAGDVCGRLDAVAAAAREGVARTVQQNASELLAKVQDKLSGEVLNPRSGTLRGSVVETGLLAGAATFSDSVVSDGTASYARIQEYGGRVSIPEEVPQAGKALAFAYGGRLVFAAHAAAHDIDIPQRSYLRASLAEQSQPFIDGIRKVVTECLS